MEFLNDFLTKSFEERKCTFNNIQRQHEAKQANTAKGDHKMTKRIPVIIDRFKESDPKLLHNRHKFWVRDSTELTNFKHRIKTSFMEKDYNPAIALFYNIHIVKEDNKLRRTPDAIPMGSKTMGELFQEYGSPDGCLYLTYTRESAFG